MPATDNMQSETIARDAAQTAEKFEQHGRAFARDAANQGAHAAERAIDQSEDAMRTFWRNASVAAPDQPLVHGIAQANMELIGFWARHARASAELTVRLMSCRTPQEFWTEQARFQQATMNDFQAMAQRSADVFSQATRSQANAGVDRAERMASGQFS